MRDTFNNLIGQLGDYHVPVDEAYLHGLLTGYATIPQRHARSLGPAIAAEQPLPELVFESALAAINAIGVALSTGTFQARFEVNRVADARRWLDGYFKAVEIHESQWEALSELHPNAGFDLLMLHGMADATLAKDVAMDLLTPEDLQKRPQLVTGLVMDIYDDFHGKQSDAAAPLREDAELYPVIDETQLSSMDEAALMALVSSNDDRLPYAVVAECASRGRAMTPLLRGYLENETNWGEDASSSDGWGLLHAIFILGLMPGEDAAQALLGAFRRCTSGLDDELYDWTAGCWAALFRNKTQFTTETLQQIAERPDLPWSARIPAVECVMAAADDRGAAALEQAIDWLAALCADDASDPEFRVVAGHSLLDLPRQRHRLVMEALVDLQESEPLVGEAYSRAEVESAFDLGDQPEWKRFENPWQFYDPDEIMARQTHWRDEAMEDEWDWLDAHERRSHEPFVREQPRIGRNEPCPCGSGKKYKKCCLKSE